MPSPISNYSIPGVYVTQSGSQLTSVAPTGLNIAIVADDVVQGYNTDTFYNVAAISGITIGQLTVPMVNNSSNGTYTSYSGYTVTWVSGTTVVTGTYGVNFNIVPGTTTNAFSYITTSGVTASSAQALPSGTVQITYGHNWGAYGTFYNYNSAANQIGTSISGSTITHPSLLATQLAFSNGAGSVTILPVARLATLGSGSATVNDWSNTFTTSGTGSNPVYASTLPNIDVIVPLYGHVYTSGNTYGQVIPYGTNTVAGAIVSYLATQSGAGVFQRAFFGIDGTANQTNAAQSQAFASGIGASAVGTRISVLYPPQVNYNPGLSTSTGLTNNNFNIPGYYVAAAVAGVFVGQPNVADPITNSKINGFNYIPNQISLIDAQTNYLPYGITTVFQKRDGNFWILHGLTTNTTNWLTQEISIQAVGDALANQIRTALQNTNLIGGPLSQNTAGAALGEVQAQLTLAVANGLIQSYQNLSYTLNPATPTTVNISFQYAPTYPLNYLQVVLSLNTQTGTVLTINQQTNQATY